MSYMSNLKRPRGLFKAHLARGKVSEPLVTDLQIEHLEDPEDTQLSPLSKKRRLSPSHEQTPRAQSQERSKAGVEDWEDIKELFSNAIDKYEGLGILFELLGAN
jgi:hypothetical protein